MCEYVSMSACVSGTAMEVCVCEYVNMSGGVNVDVWEYVNMSGGVNVAMNTGVSVWLAVIPPHPHPHATNTHTPSPDSVLDPGWV